MTFTRKWIFPLAIVCGVLIMAHADIGRVKVDELRLIPQDMNYLQAQCPKAGTLIYAENRLNLPDGLCLCQPEGSWLVWKDIQTEQWCSGAIPGT